MRLPAYADVLLAAERISGAAHRTPVLRSRTADSGCGAEIFFKCENFQRMGAFKFRGAYNAIAALDEQRRRAGVLAFSSGNHAQAIALSAQLQGVHAVIVMPEDAPAAKLAATRGYGGEVITYDRFGANREEISARIAAERGMTLIPPYDHPDVIAGQGTAALELFDEVGELDALYVCVGGGGLVSGCALAAAELSAGCAVYGVEPEAGNDAQQSLRSGSIVTIAVPHTIADGAQTTHLGQYTFPIMRERVREILTVSDGQLIDAMKFFAQRMKIVVEPTGCLGAAAVFAAGRQLAGQKIGVILSGGNVDLEAYGKLLAS